MYLFVYLFADHSRHFCLLSVASPERWSTPSHILRRTAPHEADLAQVLTLLLLSLIGVLFHHDVLLELLPAELLVWSRGLMMRKLLRLRVRAVVVAGSSGSISSIISSHRVKGDAVGFICAVRWFGTLHFRDRLHLIVSVPLLHLLDATLTVESAPNDLISLHKLIQLFLKVVIL